MNRTSRHVTVANSVLQVQLLGQTSLAVGERQIDDAAWPPRGGRELLLLLLATPGHRLARDRVLDTLWPDLPPLAARNAYYKAVHSLKRRLEPELPAREAGRFLRSDTDWVTLEAENIRVDVDAFEQALAAAEAADESGRIDQLRAAMALYRGDLLGHEPGAGWAVERREHLRTRWLRAALSIAELEIAAGQTRAAVDHLNAILSGDPTNEAGHRLLIRAYDLAGQRDLALRQYERCVVVLRDDLGVEPSAETRRVVSHLLEPVLATPSTPRRQHRWTPVPVPATRLIGRETEVEEIATMLLTDHARLVTLTGPGGVGKTRLAIETALHLAKECADGACFVALAAVPNAHLVPSTIAQALGLRDERTLSTEASIKTALRDREALLVLDNFEHVRAAAPILAEILETCPAIRTLVTSREPLHLRAERLFPVSPLDVPDIRASVLTTQRLARLERTEAVALFMDRARAVSPSLQLDVANAKAIARICQRLDGLPLAIELAAARVREVEPSHLLNLLADRLGTLVDGYQDLPARQQTMRDAIAWSYELLEPPLQRLFRRMAVFTSGCSPEIATWITDESSGEPTLALQALVDKSLAYWRDDAETYAGMLETTREFALDRLEHTDDADAVRGLLGDYALELTAAATAELAGVEQAAWLDRLDIEHDTLRTALAWSIEHQDADCALTLVGNLWRYWWSRGHLSEGRSWLDRALQLVGESDLSRRGYALNGAASLAESQGDFARAVQYHEGALAIWRTLGDRVGEARALSGLGTAAAHHGEFLRARKLHEQSLELSRAAGDHAGMARVFDRLGTVCKHEGKLASAEVAYTESLTLFREAGDLVNVSIVLSNLGEVLQRQGLVEQAAERFEEALRLERELDLPDGIAFDLMNLARVRLELGEIERAAALIGQATSLFRDMGNDLGLASALAVSASISRAGGDLLRARAKVARSLGILAALDERAAMPEHLEELAAVMFEEGSAERALRVIGAAMALRDALGSPPTATQRSSMERLLAMAGAVLGRRAAAAALRQGRAVPLSKTLAEATNDA